MMMTRHGGLSLAVAVSCLLLIWLTAGCRVKIGEDEEQQVDPVERGEYLVTIIGCNDCHTPAKTGPDGIEPDMTRMLSGHPSSPEMPPPPELAEGPWTWTGAATSTAFAGPWGVSYAANLTPDHETGLGAWSEEMFVSKIDRHGDQSRAIMPAMPCRYYSRLAANDLRAIYAYLRTIPAIENEVLE
jgi:mono/diheme cytochrome c family protein